MKSSSVFSKTSSEQKVNNRDVWQNSMFWKLIWEKCKIEKYSPFSFYKFQVFWCHKELFNIKFKEDNLKKKIKNQWKQIAGPKAHFLGGEGFNHKLLVLQP